jgi:hypothetical protein
VGWHGSNRGKPPQSFALIVREQNFCELCTLEPSGGACPTGAFAADALGIVTVAPLIIGLGRSVHEVWRPLELGEGAPPEFCRLLKASLGSALESLHARLQLCRTGGHDNVVH